MDLCNSYVQGPNLADHNPNGEQMSIAPSSMIRSHSVSGDLHGIQPDPIAADILRKEPEQETFAQLEITPTGISYYNLGIFCAHCDHFYTLRGIRVASFS